MTEYWVSQGNKWCDFCKIFISNNPATIRNHELGQRHKDNVTKRLNDMRKEKAAKEKEEKEAIRVLQQIEAKAKKSYQKDVANFQEARDTNARALDVQGDGEEKWEYDESSKYYYNPRTGLHYDPNSGFYYSDKIGRWVTQEEAYAALPVSGDSKGGASVSGRAVSTSDACRVSEKGPANLQTRSSPGPVVSGSLNPMRSAKGATSSIAIKRKRQDEKPKAISKEEAEALKAREAAKKRVEDREKPLLGLYRLR